MTQFTRELQTKHLRCQPKNWNFIQMFNQQKRHIFSSRSLGGWLATNVRNQLRSANLAARRALEIRAMCQGEVGDQGMWGFGPFFLSCTKLVEVFFRKQAEVVGGILQQITSKNSGDLFLENPLKLHLLGSEEPLVLGKMKEMVQGVLCLWYPK